MVEFSKIWLRPKGKALEVLQDFREEYIRVYKQQSEYAVNLGAKAIRSSVGGGIAGFDFDNKPTHLPECYTVKDLRSHWYARLSGAKKKSVAAAVVEEQARLDNLGMLPKDDVVMEGLGLPTHCSWKDHKGSRGWSSLYTAANGMRAWRVSWTSQTSSIFVTGPDYPKAVIDNPDITIKFNIGDGTIPTDLFDVMTKLQVEFDQAHERLHRL